MDNAKLEKLKVVELKAELQARNLDVKGVKAFLIERLKAAIDNNTPLVEGATSMFTSEGGSEALLTPSKRSTRRRSTRSQTRSPSPAKKVVQEEAPLETLEEEENDEPDNGKEEEVAEETKAESPAPNSPEKNEEVETNEQVEAGDTEMTEAKENGDSVEKSEQEDEKPEDDRRASRKRSHSKSRSRSRSRSAHSKSRSMSKSRSRSRSPRRRSSLSKMPEDEPVAEDEPEVEENQVGLSWYDSDLHLLIDPVSFITAKPCTDSIFDLVWSSARANYGVKEGKSCFEARITEEPPVSSYFESEEYTRGFRVGFSTNDTSLVLGECASSFGLCENGKKANGEFVEFGKPFGLDDVIGCYLDLDSSPSTIQFTLNGDDLGVAFEFDKSEILGEGDEMKALFPHISTKGYVFQVNFADNENLLGNMERPKRPKKKKPKKKVEEKRDEKKSEEEKKEEDKSNEESEKKEDDSKEDEVNGKENIVKDEDEEMKDEEKKDSEKEEKKSEEKEEKMEEDEEEEEEDSTPVQRDPINLLPDYELIGLFPEDKLISGPIKAESRSDCEVYLLVGLPGSGKSYWAKNHIEANKDKRYTVLGPDDLISKMSVDGKPRKSIHSGRWEKVYELALTTVSSLEDIATKRRRNFILDQTNAFASAQRRKMKGFGDFKRIAVVCIPSFDELKKRIELRSAEDNSVDLRDTTVDKLKANFTLPSSEFGWFEEVIFTDLKDDEARAEVKQYNEKGKRAVDYANRNKRPRNDYRRDDRRRYDDRRRDYRGDYMRDRDRRGPPQNRWGGGGGGGGAGRGYGSGGPRSGGGGGYRQDERYRSYDSRSGGGNRYSSGGGGSNWTNNYGRTDRYGRSGGGGGGGGGSRYDQRDDYRDRYGRDRDRNGGGRRNDNYRSSGQRDFRPGHRRIEDNQRDGGYGHHSYMNDQSTNNINNSNSAKWSMAANQQNSGGWNNNNTNQQQHQQYWGGYDQNQYNQQWANADPQQQQQWMAYWQQQQQQMQSATPEQQAVYWQQYHAAVATNAYSTQPPTTTNTPEDSKK